MMQAEINFKSITFVKTTRSKYHNYNFNQTNLQRNKHFMSAIKDDIFVPKDDKYLVEKLDI